MTSRRSLDVLELEMLHLLAKDRNIGERDTDKEEIRNAFNSYLKLCKRLGASPSEHLSKVVLERLHFDEFKNREYADWKRVRAAIEHENTVINHRLTWFFTLQGILIASVGFVLKDLRAAGRPDYGLVFILFLIAGIGLLLCLPIYTILRDAGHQIDQLDRWWYKKWDQSITRMGEDYPSKRSQLVDKSWYVHPPLQGMGLGRDELSKLDKYLNHIFRYWPFRYLAIITIPSIIWLITIALCISFVLDVPGVRSFVLTGVPELDSSNTYHRVLVSNSASPKLIITSRKHSGKYSIEIRPEKPDPDFHAIRRIIDGQVISAQADDINQDGNQEVYVFISRDSSSRMSRMARLASWPEWLGCDYTYATSPSVSPFYFHFSKRDCTNGLIE